MADEASNLINTKTSSSASTQEDTAPTIDVQTPASNDEVNILVTNEEKDGDYIEEEEKESIEHDTTNETKPARDVAASLMQVLHDEEISDDTEEEEEEDKKYDDDDDEEEEAIFLISDDSEEEEEEESSFAFDLMDEEALDAMHQHTHTVRHELKKMHDENKTLWKLMSTRSMAIKSRRNVFGSINKQQSHNALIECAPVSSTVPLNDANEEKSTNDEDDKHILTLRTEDFDAADAELDGSTFAALNDTKSATIRAIETITQKSKTQLESIQETDASANMEFEDEFSASRRIWYILRCLVVLYLYVVTLFQFAFIYNRDYRDFIGMFIMNWICDIFFWFNLCFEYLHFRDDIIDNTDSKIIDERNEAKSQLDAMRKATQSWRKEKHRKDLEAVIRDFSDTKDTKDTKDDNRCLNRCISRYFDANKSESFKSYRLSHKIRFDFIVNFPFDIIVFIIWRNAQSPYFIIVRLLKLLHSKRFFEYFAAAFADWIPDEGIMRSSFVSRLARLIVTGIAWLHLWSCIWFFLGSNLYISDADYTHDHINDTWLTAYYSRVATDDSQLQNAHLHDAEYLWSIYFVTVTFSTVGYGDIVPMNYFEIVLLIVYQSINYIFITIFVAELVPVIEEFCYRQLSKATQHRMLRNFFESMHIDVENQDKLLEANRYRWRQQFGMEENEILNELPRSLSMEMKYQFLQRSLLSFIKHMIRKATQKIHKDDVEKRSKLSALQAEQLIEAGLLRKIAAECEPKTYIRDQVILSQNVENHLLYLLIDGKVKRTQDTIINDDDTVINQQDQDYKMWNQDDDERDTVSNYPHFFAHESFWRATTKSQHTYIAQTMTSCFVISSTQIRAILAPYPAKSELLHKIFKMAYPTNATSARTLFNMDNMDTLRRRDALLVENAHENDNRALYAFYKYSSLIWDIMNAFFILIQCYTFIWAIAFFSTSNFHKAPYKTPLIMNWCCDMLFAVDIILRLNPKIKFVYFYPSRSVAKGTQHRKHNLAVDILCCVPFELILLAFDSWTTSYIYLLRSFKFVRLRYISASWESWKEFLGSIHIHAEISRIALFFVTVIHVFACIWYLIGSASLDANATLNWIANDEAIQEVDDSISITRSLLRSYYFVIVTLTTIGYGGIVPFSFYEQLYDVLLVICGSLFYWLLISYFTVRAQHRQQTRIEHTNLVKATEFLLQKQYHEDDKQNHDELVARLQNYFDFVLHQREGAVSFWDGNKQKPLLQSLLRYQLLTTAFDAKKANDPSRYRFLEWIPDETMLQFAQLLEWIVVCKGQSIKIKQSGNHALVLLLVTGTLWSPYSKYIFTRHTKQTNRESEINKSNIITFNVECLSPVNLSMALNKQTKAEMDLMQTMSTYLQIDTLHETLSGLYEIANLKAFKFNDGAKYQVIYQQIPPDQQQRELQTQHDYELEVEDLDDRHETDRTLILLAYKKEIDDLHVKQLIGKWLFFSIERKNGILDEKTKKEIAIYELQTYTDAKDIAADGWKINDDEDTMISISDELHFEALECCDVVQLRQCDVLESFQRFYNLRFQQYLAKAKKMGSGLKRGSILSPKLKRAAKDAVPSSDNVANLIINDIAFEQNTMRSKTDLHKLAQFEPISAKQKLLRQETLLNRSATIKQLYAKDVIKRYNTIDDQDLNTAWVQQIEAIVIDDEHRIIKIIWYFLGLLLVVTLQFVLPMRAFFANDIAFHWFVFDIMTQIYFVIDLYVEWKLFRKREKQRQSKQIRKSLFVFDFLLAIPWTFCGLWWSWNVFYYLRLIDLLRIKSIRVYWNGLRHELVHFTGKIISIHAGLSAVIYHIFALFLIASYCACLWYIIGVTQSRFRGEASSDKTWITQETKPVYYNYDDAANNNIHYYTLSIYWAMASMSSVGYGDLKPISWTETVFALLVLPFMVFFYIQFMGDMASFASNIEQSTKTAFHEKFSHTLLALNRRIEYLEIYAIQEAKQLIDLKKTIRKYLLSLWKERAGIAEDEIYSKLPYFLTRDIAYECRKKYLYSIPCLTQLVESADANTDINDIELCKTIARKLQHRIITRKDELSLEEIYVIEKGDIRLKQKQKYMQSRIDIGENEKKINVADDEDMHPKEEEIHTPQTQTSTETQNNYNKYPRFDVYLPPKESDKRQYKVECHSNLASIYCLSREILLEIQLGFDENDENHSKIENILNNYWFDENKHNVSNVIQLHETIYNTTKVENNNSNNIADEIEHKDFYIIESRKILRRTHPFRLNWDFLSCFGLFLYSLILPLQISNVFHTQSSMITGAIISAVIDIIFVIDFIFRLFFHAPHAIKKLDPFYFVTKLKLKLIFEIIAMIPLNLLGFQYWNNIYYMNVYFRLNKWIYFFLFFSNANESLTIYLRRHHINFLSARIIRISIVTIIVLHCMSCIWLQLAEYELNNDESTIKTWLNQMDNKRVSITTWSQSPAYAYLLSLYFVAVTMTTTGFGDITAVTRNEIIMTNLLIILGDALMALMAGVFMQYISSINKASLDIAIKERSITHYLDRRSDEIIKRSEEIVADASANEFYSEINSESLKRQKKSFRKLIKKVKRYFVMQLNYQHKVSTIRALTQHLPLYYRMKLLHTLFQRLFRRYPVLYQNKNLYFRLLENVQEQIYTYWDEEIFDFIVDPQHEQIVDFMMVQFGECRVYSRKEWKSKANKRIIIKSSGDLIGFRSLVLQNTVNKNEKIKNKLKKKEKPKCVITPAPCTKNEKFKIVSILRIPQNKWKQIINDVFDTYQEKINFEKQVMRNFKHDI